LTPTSTHPLSALQLPATWQAVDFISDLHLQMSEPATWQAWLQYLQQTARNDQVSALFILGDLFEVWVGDDVLTSADSGFERRCAQALSELSAQKPVYFMHGNRDFLLGLAFAQLCGMQLLADPCVISSPNAPEQRYLLSHGDELCIDDTAYQTFRREVRSPAWQAHFLAKPLAERQTLARAMRDQSQALKHTQSQSPMSEWADVDTQAALAWLQRAGASCLIHGHTHRPAQHVLATGLTREVLSDWDCDAAKPRAEILRLHWPPPHSDNPFSHSPSSHNPLFKAEASVTSGAAWLERIAYHPPS
jgi:UDP-2,3-diacylglucosamine hydrolase